MATIRNKDGQTFEVSDVDAVNMRAQDPSLEIVGDVGISPGADAQKIVAMPGEQVARTVGAAPATAADQQAQQRREYLKDKTSIVGAATRGLASGVSFGLTDRLADPEAIEADEAHYGALRTGSEIVGAFAPALFGDEAGLGRLLAGDGASVEHAASGLSSKFLTAGEVGKEAGSAGSALERGLIRAKNAAGEARTLTEGESIVNDLSMFRRQLKEDDKLFLATKGIKESALPEGMEGTLKIQEIGKTSLDADRQIDRLLRNPKALAESPKPALRALQQQETALENLQARELTLRQMFAADASGERAAALDAVPRALERNRELQQRIRAVVETKPEAAVSLPQKMLEGSVFGAVSSIAAPLGPLAHAAAAKAADLAGRVVFGRMGEVVGDVAGKARSVADAFVGAAKSPATAIAASRVLASAKFAPSSSGETKPARSTSLAQAYNQRANELRSMTAYDRTGTPRVRPEAREQIAARLDPIRAASPMLADKLESAAVARLEFYSSKLPRQPDFGVMPAGPNRYTPNDMQMRTFARYVAAGEDPEGVEKRLAAGHVSPEDAEAYRTLYPERAAALQAEIMQRLPQLQKTLPFKKRMALSIFSGVPVDPAMAPEVIATLQGHFAKENGSLGGTSNPVPSPAFGSVKKSAPEPTPGDQRAQGA